jgi:hypothetical protein
MDLFAKEDIKSISKCCSEYELLPWIDKELAVSNSLYSNPNSIHLIEKRLDKLSLDNWNAIYKNPNAIHIIEERLKIEPESRKWGSLLSNRNLIYLDKELFMKQINWCSNPNTICLIEEKINNLSDLDWSYLFTNPNAIHLIESNPGRIGHKLDFLCCNPNAIHILEEYTSRELVEFSSIQQQYLCSNPNAIHLIKRLKIDQLPLYYLCSNPNAIPLIEEMIDSLSFFEWYPLARNPSAIHLIKKELDNIEPNCLTENPSIFELKENKIVYDTLTEL